MSALKHFDNFYAVTVSVMTFRNELEKESFRKELLQDHYHDFREFLERFCKNDDRSREIQALLDFLRSKFGARTSENSKVWLDKKSFEGLRFATEIELAREKVGAVLVRKNMRIA